MTERHTPGAQDPISRYMDLHHRARYDWAIQQLHGIEGLVLDIASGAGYGSEMIARSGTVRVLGIDASPEAVARASEQYRAPNLSFQVGNAEQLHGIENHSVAAVVTFETIEHLQNPRAFLAEAARVLKQDGVLLISTPNRLLASSRYPLTGKPNNPFHVFEYTMRGFRGDVEEFFSFVQMSGQSYVARPLAFWPVQVLLKACCHALRRFGAYRIIDRYYHDPGDVRVRPARSAPMSTPSIFVARCKPRLQEHREAAPDHHVAE